jgi:transposase-like protein
MVQAVLLWTDFTERWQPYSPALAVKRKESWRREWNQLAAINSVKKIVKKTRNARKNVTPKSIRETTVTVVMQNYIFCVCVCVYVCSLVVQHAKRMRHITLSSVACVSTTFFHIIS